MTIAKAIVITTTLFYSLPSLINAQVKGHFSELNDGVEYNVETQGTFSSGKAPLWLNANKYGLSSIKGSNGYVRASVIRPESADSLWNWRIGYGLDVAGAAGFTSELIIQQAYLDARYKNFLISIGSKERKAMLKNNDLSSGSQTLGINARPIPQFRLELPDYWSLTGESNWVGIKGHAAYGIYTDDNWQKSFVGSTGRRVEHTLYHSKAGYMRIGNEEKFPLVFEGGLEMACQFGGTVKNVMIDGVNTDIDLFEGLKDFIDAFIPGSGSDPTDGAGYANSKGNTVGSWTFSLSYKFPTWKAKAYLDHYFEDHSMMFVQYGWKDGLYGLELELPKNKIVSNIVYEYLYSKYQAGPIYHDHTDAVSDQISAIDNYYNNIIYGGWQHWGQAIGNPLFTSPIYNSDSQIRFANNRIVAHHLGISGNPSSELGYRFLLSYSENWGTYNTPYPDKKYSTSLLAELKYAPSKVLGRDTRGWSLKGSFGLDSGNLLGHNNGFQITLCKHGLFNSF